jgi:hypothetical protein
MGLTAGRVKAFARGTTHRPGPDHPGRAGGELRQAEAAAVMRRYQRGRSGVLTLDSVSSTSVFKAASRLAAFIFLATIRLNSK